VRSECQPLHFGRGEAVREQAGGAGAERPCGRGEAVRAQASGAGAERPCGCRRS